MIQKMIQNDLLQPINFDHIPNASNIGDMYSRDFRAVRPGQSLLDPVLLGNSWYSVQQKNGNRADRLLVCSCGIPITATAFLMQDSVRDAFAVALKDLGYSLNSTNIKELTEAKDLLVTL